MKEVVFIRKFSKMRGSTKDTIMVYSKDEFIDGETGFDSNNILYCAPSKFSNKISKMSLEEFTTIFTSEDILTMIANGILDYNSKDISSLMFDYEIYAKYGTDKSKKETC